MPQKDKRYTGKTKDKPWYIFNVFQKDPESQYLTKDALLYQDILKYSYYNPNFKRSELDNWLVRNNVEFVNDYRDLSTRNTSYSNRVHAKKDRIDRIFNNLLNAELITVSGTKPSEKQKKLDVDVYSSRKFGQLIWLVIKNTNLTNEAQQGKKEKDSGKTNELNDNNHNIYQLVVSTLAKGLNAPYKSIMLNLFFDKVNNKGLFDSFVDHMTDVCNSTNTIYDISSLLSHVLYRLINEADCRESFLDIWYESANELDFDSKCIFRYETKLNTEQKVRNNIIGYSKEYEEQWFINRANYDTIVLEGNCEKCKQSNVVILSHDDHRNLIKGTSITDHLLEGKFDCKFCNSKGSCVPTIF